MQKLPLRLIFVVIVGCGIVYLVATAQSSNFSDWATPLVPRPSPCLDQTITVTSIITPTSAPTADPDEQVSNPYSDDFAESLTRIYSNTLVIASLVEEDIAWIHDDLSDILFPNGHLTAAIYTADDLDAPLHPPVNKGHEAMIYLSYMIDFYDQLPHVSTFMHSHAWAWHNNDLLDGSSVQIVQRLNLGKVLREGYTNLRCHWGPGCPNHLRLNVLDFDGNKPEQAHIAIAFAELFPGDPIPDILAQPCCAQFAVSRDTIRKQPRERYIALRDWLINTDLDDYTSGRVFEYAWQYLFTSSPVLCPDMHICYCDAYAVCFDDYNAMQQYLDMESARRTFEEERDQQRDADHPDEARIEHLERLVDGLRTELDGRRHAAFETGSDPDRRRQVLWDAWQDIAEHRRDM